MAEKQIMVKIDHVSKEYRLGAIGGTTLREDLERFHAKIRKKEDPTLKIGQKTPEYGKRFMALKDISFEVEKGEAVGIITQRSRKIDIAETAVKSNGTNKRKHWNEWPCGIYA